MKQKFEVPRRNLNTPDLSAKKATELIDKFRPSITISPDGSPKNSHKSEIRAEFALLDQKKVFDQNNQQNKLITPNIDQQNTFETENLKKQNRKFYL